MITEIENLRFAMQRGFYWTDRVEPNLGANQKEEFWIEFHRNATGVFDLASAGKNDNYDTCEQCVRLYQDVMGSGSAAHFFQRSGTLTVEPHTPPTGSSLVAKLENVVLEEVTIDPNTFVSTPVPGGRCLTLPSPLIFEVR